ncbi:outer membrane protein [Parvularcula sp. LCG005]|uniref:outer membrane protein n=1 Tax=Parvularcula sp. LCG005 TaxID=3078805 RepID=UPI002943D983|nr:outer membrane beta-barrel protein [Parvularcula sp. LCG005]WOI52351.1 outer membrane beta-barrel protein [Parvularcula sp. LCG005]
MRHLAVISVLFTAPAMAQETPDDVIIPSPSELKARQAYDVLQPRAALPRGRSQSAGDAPIVRQPRYSSSGGVAAMAAPVYQSRAYPKDTNGSPATPTQYGVHAEVRAGIDHPASGNVSDDILLGLGAGYDHDFGNFFVGGYLGVDWSGAEGALDEVTFADGGGVFSGTDSLGREIELGLRLGMQATDDINVYGLVALTRLTRTLDGVLETEIDDVPVPIHTTIHHDGWRLGAGSEINLFSDIFAKAEYRYTDYRDNDGTILTQNARHQVVTGVGLRF